MKMLEKPFHVYFRPDNETSNEHHELFNALERSRCRSHSNELQHSQTRNRGLMAAFAWYWKREPLASVSLLYHGVEKISYSIGQPFPNRLWDSFLGWYILKFIQLVGLHYIKHFKGNESDATDQNI